MPTYHLHVLSEEAVLVLGHFFTLFVIIFLPLPFTVQRSSPSLTLTSHLTTSIMAMLHRFLKRRSNNLHSQVASRKRLGSCITSSCSLLPRKFTTLFVIPTLLLLQQQQQHSTHFHSSFPSFALAFSSLVTSTSAATTTTRSLSTSSTSSCIDSTNNMSTLPNITNLQQLTTTTATTSQNGDLLNRFLSQTIPPLTQSSHKGSSGRILILGGSAKYTGAPYYAAMSALRTGSDLVTVHCANEALIPLKSYSPELMVEGVYSATAFDSLVEMKDHNENGDINDNDVIMNEKVNEMVHKVTSSFPRIHALIIGPGLGRCPMVLQATAQIIQSAMQEHINIVIDADGLYLLSLKENHDLFLKNSSSSTSRIVLTPNVVEYKRMVDAIGNGSEEILRKQLQNVFLIRKGHEDIIEYIPKQDEEGQGTGFEKNELNRMMICNEMGGLKRSGGLGDLLSGSVGTFLAWNKILQPTTKDATTQCTDDDSVASVIKACWMATCLTKRSTYKAFEKRKRSMTAPDVLEEVGDVVDAVASSTIQRE